MWILTFYITALAMLVSGPAFSDWDDDDDSDGVTNISDNCVGKPNASQLDTNGNGYGNACDADWNNSGPAGANGEWVTGADYLVFSACFNKTSSDPEWTTGTNPCMHVDTNEDNLIAGADYLIWSQQYSGTGLPGPSGPLQAWACTDGTDCPCDLIGSTTANGDNVLVCLDVQHPSYRDPTHANNPAATGNGGIRGNPKDGSQYPGAHWANLYGYADSGVVWSSNSAGRAEPNELDCVSAGNPYPVSCTGAQTGPAIPSVGVTCSQGGCGGPAIWVKTDSGWEDPYECPVKPRGSDYLHPNNKFCFLGIMVAGQVGAFTNGLVTSPDAPPNGLGSQYAFIHVPRGQVLSSPPSSGYESRGVGGYLTGPISFGGVQDEVGITMEVALADNIWDSDVLNSEWKWPQTQPGDESWFGGFIGVRVGAPELIPFGNRIQTGGDFTCAAGAAAGMTTVIGSASCGNRDNGIEWRPIEGTGPNEYKQSVHWPLGTWACLQSHYKNDGTHAEFEQWITTPTTGGRRKIAHIKDVNISGLDSGSGMVSFRLDPYANENGEDGGQVGVVEDTGRAYRRIIITDGEPATCAEITNG